MVQSQISVGVITFCTSSNKVKLELDNANGLPVPPSSICAFGKFQYLKQIRQENLFQYIDAVRARSERLYIVTEFSSTENKLSQMIGSTKSRPHGFIESVTYQVLNALNYLHSNFIICGNLSPSNIFVLNYGADVFCVKLFNYGKSFMTNNSDILPHPINEIPYLSPELFSLTFSLSESSDFSSLSPKTDVWALGLILFELFFNHFIFSPNYKLLDMIKEYLKWITLDSSEDLIEHICCTYKLDFSLLNNNEGFHNFVRCCITVLPSDRSKASKLMEHSWLSHIDFPSGIKRSLFDKTLHNEEDYMPFKSLCRCQYNLENKSGDDEFFNKESKFTVSTDLVETWSPLDCLSSAHIYYLWKLAGGDIETLLHESWVVRKKPPILMLPKAICGREVDVVGASLDQSSLYNPVIIELPLDELSERLRSIPPLDFFPLLTQPNGEVVTEVTSPSRIQKLKKQPLLVKETDVVYQFYRIILFKRLLQGYPYLRLLIWKEARVDIPPFYRPYIWPALLDIEGDIVEKYEKIDKLTPTPTDRQIEVDIPRCHQYDPLLSSPEAHHKFKRILKAWIASHPEFVYWQGLDSLVAPFLHLNFNNEPLVFSCLENFIPRYLHNFFLQDNSEILREYLEVFKHLIAFQDPVLSNHLINIGFVPDYYAINWFLTMFAHGFPLDKIFHLWDTLLLGDSSFPLCIGVAILMQLRDRLLASDFNECILLFSDLPQIDIDRCVSDSVKIFCSTPKSCTFRKYAPIKLVTRKNSTTASTSNLHSNTMQKSTMNEMSTISFEELSSQRTPRISLSDLIQLGNYEPSIATSATIKIPTTSPNKKKSVISANMDKLVVIDIRSSEDYQRGCLTGSINVPITDENEIYHAVNSEILNGLNPYLVKVVMGSHTRKCIQVANRLVEKEFARVCFLHSDIAKEQPKLLTVPS